MGKRLFIIGNGFDLLHRLPTCYQDYHQYLLQNGESWMANMLEFYFGNETKAKSNLLWSDLERALGIYKVEDIYSFLCEGHSLDLDHIMQSTGEVEAEVEYHFVKICETFQETFKSWCQSIDLSVIKKNDRFSFLADDVFLTFNYSDTLERIYGLNDNQVLHIHGRASTGDNLIIGHNNPATMPKNIQEDFYDHEANYKEIVVTINKLEKKTKKIISANRSFFDGLNPIDDVTVIGHSMADVDLPYFEEVKRCVETNTKWHFSYYDENEKSHIKDVAAQLVIASNKYDMFKF